MPFGKFATQLTLVTKYISELCDHCTVYASNNIGEVMFVKQLPSISKLL